MEDEIVGKIRGIIIDNESIAESQVAHLMVLMRKLIGKMEANNFQILEFFCNWSVHTELDRTPALAIIKRLNDLISSIRDCRDTNLIVALVSGVVSFRELKLEIKRLLNDTGISTEPFDNVNFWSKFAINLISILRDCPLRIPENPRKRVDKEMVEQILSRTTGSGRWIKEVSIISGPIPILGQYVNLCILHSDTTRLIVPFLFE